MKCPFCLVGYHDDPKILANYDDADGKWEIVSRICSECKRTNLILEKYDYDYSVPNSGGLQKNIVTSFLIYPRFGSRPPCPKQVPTQYAGDYNEACLVIIDSPKASAALTRRCLQLLLRNEFKVTPGNLSKEIQQVLDDKKIPSYLANSIDAIRNIGNFAAHPEKSERSGEIVDVESGEAEWSLEVLESLFDFCFVKPQELALKRDALNQKLADTNKPPMK